MDINGEETSTLHTTLARLVFVTCASQATAERIAETLVMERLAACVNIIGKDDGFVRSFYIWEGTLERATEVLLIIKTTDERLAALEKRVAELHEYTTPEFLAVPVISGSNAYLEWLTKSVAPHKCVLATPLPQSPCPNRDIRE